MNARVQGAITGGAGGALIGAIVGYLVKKGEGAGYGAAIGGVAFAAIGATTDTSSTGTGTAGLPKIALGVGGLPGARVGVGPMGHDWEARVRAQQAMFPQLAPR